MRRFRVKVDNEVFEVEIEEMGQTKGEESRASLPKPQVSSPAPVEIPAKRAEMKPLPAPKDVKAPPSQPAGGGAGAVIAPIPGVVTEIKVSAGNSVKKGDVLIILEAMKMQNEILAPYDALVSEVSVSRGASVQTGDTLIRLDR